MKITTPISSLNELEMLLHNGADELYCGIRTKAWDEIFKENWWMNRRSPSQANLSSLSELDRITREAHAAGVTVSITLNASFYPDQGMAYILDLSEQLSREIRVDALIVSDLNLLIELAAKKLPVRIHVSSLGSCFNSLSTDFYRSLGVRRIILPRQLTLREIESIVINGRDRMEYEVFAVNDGCYFEEGFCQTSHPIGPFCHTDWSLEPVFQQEADPRLSAGLPSLMTDYRRTLWYLNNCGSSFQANGLPNGPCSLCHLADFRDWGVTAIKIVGREASFHRKMGSLQMVCAVRDRAVNETGTQGVQTYARQIRNTPEYCDSGNMCYFRKG